MTVEQHGDITVTITEEETVYKIQLTHPDHQGMIDATVTKELVNDGKVLGFDALGETVTALVNEASKEMKESE